MGASACEDHDEPPSDRILSLHVHAYFAFCLYSLESGGVWGGGSPAQVYSLESGRGLGGLRLTLVVSLGEQGGSGGCGTPPKLYFVESGRGWVWRGGSSP